MLSQVLWLSLSVVGCAPQASADGADSPEGTSVAAETPAVGEDLELATLMGDLQRFSAKLGYAIEGENRRLAEFYLHEIDEVRAQLLEVEEHDGMPIAEPVQIIFTPAERSLSAALEDRSFDRVREKYVGLIDACNRCHAATEHEFLVMTPAGGRPPFNQEFRGARGSGFEQ